MSTNNSTPPSIYKTISLVDAKNRPMKAISVVDKAKIHTIVSNFIVYLKNKHS